MSERGLPPEEAGLSDRLERLLQDYSARLDSLELTLPKVDGPPEPPAGYLYKNYFPDEPAAAAPQPPRPAAPESFAPSPVEPSPPEAPPQALAAAVAVPKPAARPRPPGAAPAQAPLERRSGPVARPFEPAAAPATGERALRWGLALAAAAAAIGLWKAAAVLAQAPHRFYPLQASHLGALTASGAELYADDGGRLLDIAMDGKARQAGSIPGGPVVGLALDDAGHFWTSEDNQDVLFEHAADAARSVRKAYSYPNRRFSQVAAAGDSLWALDANTGAAYQYMLSRSLLGTSLTPISQFEGTPETALAAGLAVTQGLLWICDPARRRILRYSPEGARLVPLDTLDLSPWIAPGTRVTGMTLAGGYLWVLTGWPAGLHRLRLDDLAWKRP